MARNTRWWNWLSGLFHTRPKAAAQARTRVRRKTPRTADFADHGTAFGLDMSLTAVEPEQKRRRSGASRA